MPSRKTTPQAGNQSWRDKAACKGKDPELFFPPPVNPYTTREERRAFDERRLAAEAQAKAICGTCPVTRECYDWAIATDADGVWGGTTEAERGRTPTR